MLYYLYTSNFGIVGQVDILLIQLRENEDEAYCLLYKHYYVPLVLFAMKYVRDEDVAKDLVQEAFVAMLGRKNRFESVSALKVYLYNAVHNKSLNYIRHQKICQKYLTEAVNEPDTGLTLFEERMLEEDLFAQLMEAVDHLPRQCKKVTLLTIEGYKISEISEMLGISLDTAKDYKKKACKKLSEHFHEVGYTLLIAALFT